MAYTDGIEICSKVVAILASGNELEKRVDKAFNELKDIGVMDTSIEYFREIIDWCEKYHLMKQFDFKLDGMAKNINYEDNEDDLTNLSISLAKLCAKIIQHNAIND